MHVLLLAHYFPPDGGPGAQRPISFARHLPGLGARCTVLTRSPPARRGPFDPADPETTAALEREVTIVRARPGAEDWPALHEALVEAGSAAIARERPDLVLATMSPFALWRVAAELGERHRLPVVFDLRDPWALDGVLDYRTWWRWRRAFVEMRTALRLADGVIANTADSRAAIQRAIGIADERIVVVTNGWDRDDFAAPEPTVEPGEHLTLLHAGSFLCDELYAHERPLRRAFGWLRHRPEPIDPSGRTPLHLLRAFAELRRSGHPAGHALRLRVVGNLDDALWRCTAESGVADMVVLDGYRSHAETVAAMRRADALFLTLHGLAPGRRARIVPGKTYEYLRSGRPMLACLPPGDAEDLVRTAPRAWLAAPTDAGAIARQLVDLYAQWRGGMLRRPMLPSWIEDYERRHLTGELLQFLRRIRRPA